MPNLVLIVVSASCSLALLVVYGLTLLEIRRFRLQLQRMADAELCLHDSKLKFLRSCESDLEAQRSALAALQSEGFKALDASLKIVNAHSSSVMRVLNSAATAGDGSEREVRGDSAEPIVERTVGDQ